MLMQLRGGDRVCSVTLSINMPNRGILFGMEMNSTGQEGEVGYSTNGYMVIDDLIKE
jgi:hypothetical protein